nr:hypothetical protein [Tanacetum cinerariifolium]
MAVKRLCDGSDFISYPLDMCERLCDGGAPRRLWLEEDYENDDDEDNVGLSFQ